MTPAPKPIKAGDHLFLVDGSSYIFRAFHALPPLTRKSDGLPVGAVAGFCNMLWKLLRDNLAGEKPTHLAVIFDHSAKTFRNDLYAAYKAQRPEPPEDLRPQFGLIREAVRAFDIPAIDQRDYEADDLIATYARQAREAGATVLIVASDKDLMQLVGDGVAMLDPVKEKRIGDAEVMEKFGVSPDKVVEVQALAGDFVDNVPGIPGIGIKTAAQLITQFGSLEALLERAGEIPQPKRRESLIAHAEKARISRRLVKLDDHVPLAIPLQDLGLRDPNPNKLIAFFKALEFTTITRRVADAFKIDPARIAATDAIAVRGAGTQWGAAASEGGDQRQPSAARPAMPSIDSGEEPGFHPPDRARQRLASAKTCPFDFAAYEIVTDFARLDAWIAQAFEAGIFAVDTETSSLDAMQADLIGVSLALVPGQACYIPLGHVSEGSGDLFGGQARLAGQLEAEAVVARLKPVLESSSVLKIGQNMKFDWLVFSRFGVEVAPIDDTMLMSYVLDAGVMGHGMDELSETLLGHKTIAFGEVAGSGKSFIGFARVPIEQAARYAAEDADVTLRLWQVLKARLCAERMMSVYETLERPMPATLARMERRGISVDRAILQRLSLEFAQGMAGLEREIQDLAGEPFNLGSPKQLGDILFGKMGLGGAKKTASGAWSTSASVLEDLAEQGHPLPARILDWRQLAKLKSTYSDALPNFVHPATQRVHTSYALAATTTGRLSSSDPNLQNIPVRNEAGRKISHRFRRNPGASAPVGRLQPD